LIERAPDDFRPTLADRFVAVQPNSRGRLTTGTVIRLMGMTAKEPSLSCGVWSRYPMPITSHNVDDRDARGLPSRRGKQLRTRWVNFR